MKKKFFSYEDRFLYQSIDGDIRIRPGASATTASTALTTS